MRGFEAPAWAEAVMQVSDPGRSDPQTAAIHSVSPGEAQSSETLCTNGYDLSGPERWKDVGRRHCSWRLRGSLVQGPCSLNPSGTGKV